MYKIEITADTVSELRAKIDELSNSFGTDGNITWSYLQSQDVNNQHLGEIQCPHCHNYFKMEINNSIMGVYCPYCSESVVSTEIVC